jgi:hypothetical protein
VLTYYSPSWDAKLFYNTANEEMGLEEKCATSVKEVFRIPRDRVHVDDVNGLPLTVYKQSQDPAERHLGLFEYQFWVQPVAIQGLPQQLRDDGSFRARDDYDYHLVTLATLKRDPRAMEVNGDEINFISREFGGNTLRHVHESAFGDR